MRVVRAAGQNVSPSDDGRLYDQIFSDGLFTDTTFTNLGSNNVQVSAMYGDLCGRDFTIEQMTLAVTLPDGEGETTGYIYVEIDTSSEDVITLNSALAPFTPTYEDINTNGAVAQMVLAEYTASAVAVTSVTPVYPKATAGSLSAGSVATVENAQAVASHSAGDYILLGGKLYLVTAAVSVGETFVEGTNIEAAVIGDALTALNNGLMSIACKEYTSNNFSISGNNNYTFQLSEIGLSAPTGYRLLTVNYVVTGSASVANARVHYNGIGGALDDSALALIVHNQQGSANTWSIRIVAWYIKTDSVNVL